MSSEEIDEIFDSLMETITEVNQSEKSVYLKVYPTEAFVKISPADANRLFQTNRFIGYRMRATGMVYLCLKGE